MALNVKALEALALPEMMGSVSLRDAIFYALSIGMDMREAPFVYEGTACGLRVAPTMPFVIGELGPWWEAMDVGMPEGGPLHGEQALWLHAPVPVDVPLVTNNRVAAVHSVTGGHAMLVVERQTRRVDTGAVLATARSSMFCPRAGGFGEGFDRRTPMPVIGFVPEGGAPDAETEVTIPPTAALLYRLNVDMNPLHVDPVAAKAAGFEAPILHGLATLGYVVTALGRLWPDAWLSALSVRFTAPVYPEDRLQIKAWRQNARVHFDASVEGRQVLARGSANLAG